MPKPILLDDETTWPPALLEILTDGLPTLRAFFDETRRIDRLAEADVLLRWDRPHNPNQGTKEEIYDAAARALAGHSVVGWHCTRLCDDEVEAIMRDGMYPLSEVTFNARLERRIDAGDIPSSIAHRFRKEHQAGDENRQMLWFIFSRDSLRWEAGVGRLFTSWGGEALYNSHEHDGDTGPVLRSIGRPCIVEAELPLERIEAHWTPAEWIVRPYLHRRGINDGHDPERDGHVRKALGPERMRRVISADDPEFEALTGVSKWRCNPC